MKQIQIVAVFNIIQRLMNDINLPSDISYAFFRVNKIIQNQVEFQIERQKALKEKYHGRDGDNGQVMFDSKEDRDGFNREMEELMAMEITLDKFDKVPFRNDGRCNLSISDLSILEDFMEYI